MKKVIAIALATVVLSLAGLALIAQQRDDLFDLRRELLDRIETAYSEGDSATLSRMAETERRIERLESAGPDFFREADAIGVASFRICPESYHLSASETCVPEASAAGTSAPVGPMVVTMANVRPPQPQWPHLVSDGNHDPGEPGLGGGPDIGTPTISCTVDDPAAAAAAAACSAEEEQICATGTAAQCQAKSNECSGLWAAVTVTCS